MSTTTQGHQLTEDRIERIGLPDSVMAVTDLSDGQTDGLTIRAPKPSERGLGETVLHRTRSGVSQFRSPRRDPFIARSTSRVASRVLMDSRRSCCFLPLANPSSTLARPRLEK